MALFSCNSSEKTNDSSKIEEKVKVEKVEPLKLGDKYEGGYIFFLDFEGKHGKICAPYSEGDENKVIQLKAIKLAEKLTLNGFSDWRLPTVDELEMIRNLDKYTVFSFKNTSYWSSEYEDVRSTFDNQISYTNHYYGIMEKESGGSYATPSFPNDNLENFEKYNYRVIRDF